MRVKYPKDISHHVAVFDFLILTIDHSLVTSINLTPKPLFTRAISCLKTCTSTNEHELSALCSSVELDWRGKGDEDVSYRMCLMIFA